MVPDVVVFAEVFRSSDRLKKVLNLEGQEERGESEFRSKGSRDKETFENKRRVEK